MKRDIKNMTPEELRAYNLAKKHKQRDREKQEKLHGMVIPVDEYEMPQTHQQRLSEHVNQVLHSIQSEITPTERDIWIIDMIGSVTYGLEHDIKQQVHINESLGMLVGGTFPDAAWSIAIEHTHRNPAIMESPTFTALYKKFLDQSTKFSRTHFKYVSADLLDILNQDNAGTYVLPTPAVRTPQVAPPRVESPAITPSVNLWTGVSSEAMKYLKGI